MQLYLVFMGALHFAVFLIGCVIIVSIGFFGSRPRRLMNRIGRFALFMGILLVVGWFFNGLWSCLIWDRLYHSVDYVFDFSPFWPITQSLIDASWGDARGRLFGVTLFQLQLVWFLFAASVWTITTLLFRWFCRRLPKVNEIEPTANALGIAP